MGGFIFGFACGVIATILFAIIKADDDFDRK